ncbi:hypothetical protein DFJ73DRAFT_148123 [Zopfochytrium polystomum]|nr:hypothetical protein DFJ73DRAFT_148123 [Zopfochytrium polystomum]
MPVPVPVTAAHSSNNNPTSSSSANTVVIDPSTGPDALAALLLVPQPPAALALRHLRLHGVLGGVESLWVEAMNDYRYLSDGREVVYADAVEAVCAGVAGLRRVRMEVIPQHMLQIVDALCAMRALEVAELIFEDDDESDDPVTPARAVELLRAAVARPGAAPALRHVRVETYPRRRSEYRTARVFAVVEDADGGVGSGGRRLVEAPGSGQMRTYRDDPKLRDPEHGDDPLSWFESTRGGAVVVSE